MLEISPACNFPPPPGGIKVTGITRGLPSNSWSNLVSEKKEEEEEEEKTPHNSLTQASQPARDVKDDDVQNSIAIAPNELEIASIHQQPCQDEFPISAHAQTLKQFNQGFLFFWCVMMMLHSIPRKKKTKKKTWRQFHPHPVIMLSAQQQAALVCSSRLPSSSPGHSPWT